MPTSKQLFEDQRAKGYAIVLPSTLSALKVVQKQMILLPTCGQRVASSLMLRHNVYVIRLLRLIMWAFYPLAPSPEEG